MAIVPNGLSVPPAWGGFLTQTRLGTMLPINYFYWYPAFLVISGINYSFLDQLADVPEEYIFGIYLVSALHGLISVLILAALEAGLAATGSSLARSVSAMLAGLVPVGFCLDLLIYQRMSLHLWTGLRLLFESGLTQFR